MSTLKTKQPVIVPGKKMSLFEERQRTATQDKEATAKPKASLQNKQKNVFYRIKEKWRRKTGGSKQKVHWSQLEFQV